jgi:hypothetical protein
VEQNLRRAESIVFEGGFTSDISGVKVFLNRPATELSRLPVRRQYGASTLSIKCLIT